MHCHRTLFSDYCDQSPITRSPERGFSTSITGTISVFDDKCSASVILDKNPLYVVLVVRLSSIRYERPIFKLYKNEKIKLVEKNDKG